MSFVSAGFFPDMIPPQLSGLHNPPAGSGPGAWSGGGSGLQYENSVGSLRSRETLSVSGAYMGVIDMLRESELTVPHLG